MFKPLPMDHEYSTEHFLPQCSHPLGLHPWNAFLLRNLNHCFPHNCTSTYTSTVINFNQPNSVSVCQSCLHTESIAPDATCSPSFVPVDFLSLVTNVLDGKTLKAFVSSGICHRKSGLFIVCFETRKIIHCSRRKLIKNEISL